MSDDRKQKAAAAAKANSKSTSQLTFFAGIAAVVLVIIGTAVFAITNQESTPTGQTPANTQGYAVVVGQEDAPVKMTVFEDFQCPVCQVFETAAGDTISQLIAQGDLQVAYNTISFLDRASTTQYSSRAANAAACVADDAGTQVWAKMHKQLYQNQPAEGGQGLPDSDLIEFAKEAGASDEVEQCIDEKRFSDWVEQGTQDAFDNQGVGGTPTIIIDGETFDYTGDPAAVVQALQQAVADANR